eukprot:scaffold60275_cov19-Tisochrysis_lutea.AAC.1
MLGYLRPQHSMHPHPHVKQQAPAYTRCTHNQACCDHNHSHVVCWGIRVHVWTLACTRWSMRTDICDCLQVPAGAVSRSDSAMLAVSEGVFWSTPSSKHVDFFFFLSARFRFFRCALLSLSAAACVSASPQSSSSPSGKEGSSDCSEVSVPRSECGGRCGWCGCCSGCCCCCWCCCCGCAAEVAAAGSAGAAGGVNGDGGGGWGVGDAAAADAEEA